MSGLRGGAVRRTASRARRWWPAEWRVLKYGDGLPIEAIRRDGWILREVGGADTIICFSKILAGKWWRIEN